MTPTVFAYVVLFTLLLAAGAAAVEWGTQGRGAARHFWTAAIVLAVLAPSGALTLHALDARTATGAAAVAGPPVLARIIINSGREVARRGYDFIGRDALIRLIAPSRRAMRAALVRIARDFATTALVVWIVLSTLLIVWLAVGVFHWRRAQRSWERTIVDGVSVDVSAMTGPAVVGFLSHRIVLPSWATTIQPEHRRLVLAHESEHIAARDPERLMLAIIALVLMPWNIGLWWCAARLRRAIELDCDMRVLNRYPSAKDYGHVLLEVAARGRNSGPLAVPMVALLRLPSELELRLRAMTRAKTVGIRSALAGGLVALVAITAAFKAPVPSIITRSATGSASSHPVSVVNRTPLHRPTDSTATLRRLDARAQADTGRKQRTDSLSQRLATDSLVKLDHEIAARMDAEVAAQARVLALARKRSELFNRLRTTHPAPPPPGNNTTYFSFQLEKPAHMLPTTPTPLYPDSLRRAGIDGEVDAQFVVDTLGHVDTTMVMITSATDPAFARAVRTALPKMRFAPAEIGGRRVKQLVQQPFTFAINKGP